MRRRTKFLGAFAAGTAALAIALPALGQDAPESLLPPGFEDPPSTAQPTTNESQPANRRQVPATPRTPSAASLRTVKAVPTSRI